MNPDNEKLSKFQRLELEHAQRDEGALADIENSNALAFDQSEMEKGYLVKVFMAICSISLGTLATFWGFSPPAAIISVINEDIGPSANASLFAVIWAISSAISIIIFGRLSDKFGRRWWVLSASFMGLIGGIIACTAQNMNTLVGANVLLGLSGGVHTCYALTVGEICPNKYKLVGIVICVFPNVIPTGFGAYLAVMLTHTANWRWCYYIYIMIMASALVLEFFFYHPPSFDQLHGGQRTIMQEIRRIDFVGIFLLVSGLALFLLGVSWGGQPLPWTSARILCLIIIGGILIIAFVIWEIYSNVPNPLVPMHFFKDVRGFVCLNIICAVSGILYVSMSIIWPSQVAAIYGAQAKDWRENAWLSTTIAFGIWGGIVVFGSVFHIIKHIRIQTIVFMLVCTAFAGALASGNTENKNQSAAFSFLATLPAGILELIPVTLCQLDANDADLGTVFAIIFLMRTAWGSIFTAVFLAILSNKTPSEIATRVPDAAVAAGLPSSSLGSLFAAIAAGTPKALAAVPGINPDIQQAVANSLANAHAAAYAFVYYAAVAIGMVGVIAAVFMKDYDHMLTSHVSRRIGSDRKNTGGDSEARSTPAEADEKAAPAHHKEEASL